MNPEPRPTKSRAGLGHAALIEKTAQEVFERQTAGPLVVLVFGISFAPGDFFGAALRRDRDDRRGDVLDQRRQARHRDRKTFRDLRG